MYLHGGGAWRHADQRAQNLEVLVAKHIIEPLWYEGRYTVAVDLERRVV